MFINTATRKPIAIGDVLSLDGQPVTVTHMAPPHRPGTTGKISVSFADSNGRSREFFAGVLGAEWSKPEQPQIHISGRRWFQRTYGNTYHSVRILIDGQVAAHLGPCYGYGDQFLQTGLDWLKANGYAPADAEYGTLYLRETLGGSYDVADVDRKRDL